MREDGIIQSHAVLLAIGINWEGKRQVVGVELANRERQTTSPSIGYRGSTTST